MNRIKNQQKAEAIKENDQNKKMICIAKGSSKFIVSLYYGYVVSGCHQ